jgi:Uma2 family endonuclease
MSTREQQLLDFDWLRDDSEEDLVGADWHQDAIRALSTSLKTLVEERHWTWHVGDQLTLVGEIPGDRDWRPGPDISIHPTLGLDDRRDIDVRVDGPPTLLIEVASASTWEYDVSMESTRRGRRRAGKAYGYLALLHIPEYLVFDPLGEFLPERCRAWRRVGDEIQEWPVGPDGRYLSTLGLAFRPEGPLLRVFDPEERPVPFWFEVSSRARELEQELTALRAELELLRQRDTADRDE